MEKAVYMKPEDMNSEEGLKKAIDAANRLAAGLTHEFPDTIKEIRAIREQKQRMQQLKLVFGKSIVLFFRHQFALRPKRVIFLLIFYYWIVLIF